LVQNLWGSDLNPGINGPFWSLTYEWVYYILFGIFYFIKNNKKWFLLILVALLAGPSILFLFPVWLLGYALFRIKITLKEGFEFSYIKACLAILTIGLLIFVGPQMREIKTSISWLSRSSIAGDYFDAIIFVFHLYFCPYLIHLLKPILIRYEKIIRWCASLTFALYLFHRPIIQLIAAINDGSQNNNMYRMTILIVTFIVVATIGRWCEQNKYVLKRYLSNLIIKK
jgi:peptidoglycan/LPS O-acetylase OafA/YrhL